MGQHALRPPVLEFLAHAVEYHTIKIIADLNITSYLKIVCTTMSTTTQNLWDPAQMYSCIAERALSVTVCVEGNHYVMVVIFTSFSATVSSKIWHNCFLFTGSIV